RLADRVRDPRRLRSHHHPRRGSRPGLARAPGRDSAPAARSTALHQCSQVRRGRLVAHHHRPSARDVAPGATLRASGDPGVSGVAIFVKTPGHSPVKTRLAADRGQAWTEAWYRRAAAAVAAVARAT